MIKMIMINDEERKAYDFSVNKGKKYKIKNSKEKRKNKTCVRSLP